MKLTDFKSSKSEQCAKEIIRWIIKHGGWGDTNVYAKTGGKWRCFTNRNPETGHYTYQDSYSYENDKQKETKAAYEKRILDTCVFIIEDDDPSRCFEWTGNFVCLSTEGWLYDALNYGNGKAEDQLWKICQKYGKYFERGYAWSLALYDN